MQNLILEEKGILDLVDQAIILSFSGNEKNLHPQTVDRITFPSSFSMLNKICQFLSITRTLQYQTVYPQKFFDILPVYRPETRGGGEGGRDEFSAFSSGNATTTTTTTGATSTTAAAAAAAVDPSTKATTRPVHTNGSTVRRSSKAGPAFERVQLARVENT